MKKLEEAIKIWMEGQLARSLLPCITELRMMLFSLLKLANYLTILERQMETGSVKTFPSPGAGTSAS